MSVADGELLGEAVAEGFGFGFDVGFGFGFGDVVGEGVGTVACERYVDHPHHSDTTASTSTTMTSTTRPRWGVGDERRCSSLSSTATAASGSTVGTRLVDRG